MGSCTRKPIEALQVWRRWSAVMELIFGPLMLSVTYIIVRLIMLYLLVFSFLTFKYFSLFSTY